jgi:Tfp pilus assembly protein PilW
MLTSRFVQFRRQNSRRGTTLLELMIAAGIGSLVLMAMASLSYFSARSFVAMGNYSDLDRASRAALDQMTRDIRMTTYLISSATNQLVFSYSSGTNLSFTWDPTAKTLVRSKTGEPDKILLGQCDYLLFNTYQRNMSNQVYGAFSNSTAQTCKLVDLSWRCSRQILAKKVNTESVQTAKIVIRNEHPH